MEWLDCAPEEIKNSPKLHPATWQRVLLEEFARESSLDLQIFCVRKEFRRSLSFKGSGATFHCVRVPGGLRTASLFWWDTLVLKRRLRSIQPDLVHAWGSERGAALVATRLGYPFLVTMQGLLEWYLQHVDLGRVVRLEAILERVALRRATHVTTECTFAVQWLRDHYPHLQISQVEHAPNWLFHRIQRQPELQPVRFLSVAPIAEIKGGDLLLLALNQLTEEVDFRLTIVGSGAPAYVQALREKTSSRLWERIDLKNRLTQAEVANELSKATMMLFPTRVDTSPNSVKEATVAGVPVVASAIGGICDYIYPGRNGLLFAPGDLSAFVRQIRQALRDPLFKLGKVDPVTLENVRQQLSPAVMARKFRDFYDQVLNRKPPA